MTLTSSRISSDFDLFYEIIQEVESNKEEENTFFNVPHTNEQKKEVDTVATETEAAEIEAAETELNKKDINENLNKSSNGKNSTSSGTVETSASTNTTEDHTHYAESDFESISSNGESDDDSITSDKSNKKSVSSKSSSKSPISKKNKHIKSDNEDSEPYTKNTSVIENSEKENMNDKTSNIEDIQPAKIRNKSAKSRRRRKSKEKLKRDETAKMLYCKEDVYDMYRESNFPVMEDLWQGSEVGSNKRIRSKSAAPSQMKSRHHSSDRSHERTQSQSRARPQSEKKDKKINLAFSTGNICSKVDTRVEDSGNPVLLSWLHNKKRLANHQQKIEKEEKKLQQYENREKFLHAYQRTMDSGEKVKQWIDNKKQLDKEKRHQRKNLLDKLKVDTIEHQRRLVSPMFIKNRFCEMNPAVIDQIKQKTNRNIVAPLRDSTNMISYMPCSKRSRDTFFKYYLNDPHCPKGYTSIKSFATSVLQDAAKEVEREVKVKKGRLRRPKTALLLQQLNQPKETLYKDSNNIAAKPPIPPSNLKAPIHSNDMKQPIPPYDLKPPVPPDSFKHLSKHAEHIKTYDEWMQEKKMLRMEKTHKEKNIDIDDRLKRQSSVQERETQIQNKFESKLKRSRSFKSAVRPTIVLDKN